MYRINSNYHATPLLTVTQPGKKAACISIIATMLKLILNSKKRSKSRPIKINQIILHESKVRINHLHIILKGKSITKVMWVRKITINIFSI